MYRQSSFTGSPLGRSSSQHDISEPLNDENHVVYLKTSGKFLNKNNPVLQGGLVTAFRNHTARNKTAAVTAVSCNPHSGGFAIADERGQVYKMSIQHNTYNSIRLASTRVSAMCFVNQHKNHLVIAYESGSIVVVDSHTKDIVGNLQVKNKSVARIIQSHPSQLKIAIASDDKTLSVWDLNTCQCVQSMQCDEPIVDVRYELNGAIIVVVLEHTGAYLYSTGPDAALKMHLKLPPSEEAPKWTAYCAYNVYLDVAGHNPRQARLAEDPVAMNVILASNTSLLYSWHVNVADLLDTNTQNQNNQYYSAAASLAGSVKSKSHANKIPPSHLVGVVELPLKNRVAVAIQLLHPNATNSGTRAAANTTTLGSTTLTNTGSSASSTLHRQSSFTSSSNNLKSLAATQLSASAGGASAATVDLPPRVLILTEEGGMLIVDIEGFQLRSVGFFTVKADLDASILHGTSSSNNEGYGQMGGGWSAQAVGSVPRRQSTSTAPGAITANQSAYGRVHSAKNSIVVVGCDGVARLFDIRGALGTGSLCGSVLRSRIPKANTSGASHHGTNGATATSALHVTTATTSTTVYQSKGQSNLNNYMMSQANSRTHPGAASASPTSHATRSPEVAHYMTHPSALPSRSIARTSSGAVSAVSDLDSVTSAGLDNENDNASERYDFILHDSRDDELNGTSNRKRGSHNKFRSVSTGRALSGGGVSTVGSVSGGGSVMGKVTGRAASVTSRTSRYSGNTATTTAGPKLVQSFVGTHKARKTGILSSSKKQGDTASMPLFELATLCPKEHQVNVRKLKNFLDLNGEYPARYRPLIWRFLLRLPENATGFSALVNRGVHSSYENLSDMYPIQNRKVFDRLQGLCSQLTHWAPILAEASYLPALVFPFTLVFNTDELAALEVCMSVMMWWGHSWHATHPNPPVHILDALDTLLKYHEVKLYNHLKKLQVSPGVVAWSMLSNLFTEVLSRTAWLKMMDYLFCHFEDISLILIAPIVVMRDLKTTLLTCDTANQIHLCLRTQQNVNMTIVTRTMGEWLKNTPPKYFTAIATRHLDGKRLELGPHTTTDEVRLSEVDEAGENLALSSGRPLFPLPRGRYPVYDGYPQSILDLQIRERNKILALGKEVSRRESVLTALQQKLTEVESDHAAWMNKHKSASDAELRHHTEMMLREREHLSELQRIEEEISRQRLSTLNSLEAAAKDEMDLMDKAARDSAFLLQQGEEHMREKMHIQLGLQKHRELAEQAEVATHDRIRHLQMRRIREDWVKNVSESIKSREEMFGLRDTLLQEQWKKDDDKARLVREQREAELKQMEEESRLSSMQEDMQMRMQRLQLERDAKVVEIERARALRLAKEQADEALESAQRSSLLLRKHELHTTVEQSAQLAEASVRQAESKLMETVGLIQEESNKLLEAERVHTLRQNKARMAARQAQLRQEHAERSGAQLQSVLSAQGELQAQVLRLQQAALRSEADRDLAYSSSTSANAGQFAETKRHLESMEEGVLQQQRQRFEEMQAYLKAQHAQQMAALNEERGKLQTQDSSANGNNSKEKTEQEHTSWDLAPSVIPAPLSGAGIGYGVRPPVPPTSASTSTTTGASREQSVRVTEAALRRRSMQQADDLSDIERDAADYNISLEQAMRAAKQALTAHDKLQSGSDNSDDDLLDLVGSHSQSQSQSRTQSQGQTSRAQSRYATSTSVGSNRSSGVGEAWSSGRTLQQDALDIAAAADDVYSVERVSEGRVKRGSYTTTTRTTTTMSSTEGLRHLAEQSLRNLNATRLMNRDEVEQEHQEHDIMLHSSPGTGVAASSTVGNNDSMPQRSASPPTTTATSTTRSSNAGNVGGSNVPVTSTIWDVDYGSEEERN